MTILNRYVLKKFLMPFFSLVGVMCVIILVSQAFERLDRFLADGVSLTHVVAYLLSSLPFMVFQYLPVACFVATLYVVGNLARTKEYIAGLAGGIPPEKFLGGLFWAGLMLSVVALVANETIIPPATQYSRSVYKEKIRLGQGRQTIFNHVLVSGADGRVWNIKLMNQETGKMERVIVDKFENGQIKFQIDARGAQWNGAEWAFTNGVYRTFSQLNQHITTSTFFEERSFKFKEQPTDLVPSEPEPEEMNFRTLRRHIERLSSLGIPVRKLRVELMMKLAFPFSCFIVILLGIPLAMKGKGSWGMGIATALLLTIAYMGCIQFGRALAYQTIPPLLGAWLGNLIFFAIGLTLWLRMRRTA